jgi:hypothetical protein
MPFSWINFSGITRPDFELTPEGCDIHALELVNNDVNFQRSNHPMSNSVVTPLFTYIEFIQGRDSRNKDVAKIMPSRQGDAARAKFYMMLCYNGKYAQNWGLNNLLSDSDNQELQKLIDMHFADLPDGFEKARHEYVFSKQGNRNPFIDFPQLVNCINFSDMTITGDCSQLVGISNISQPTDFVVYPQPANDLVNLSFTSPAPQLTTLTVHDLTGKQVSQTLYSVDAGQQQLQLNTATLLPGYYLFTLQGDALNARGRFTVVR